ncbi:MAG: hypothetical protein AB7D37_16195 [Desulfovibrio sp.]
MHTVLPRFLLLCLLGLGLALPKAAFCQDTKKPEAVSWEGEYMGAHDILRIGDCNGQSFRFRFENRENAANTRQGQAEVDGQSHRKGHGLGFDFVLADKGRRLTVTAGKKGANRKGDAAKLAGSYIRLDCLERQNGHLVLRQDGKPLPEGVATLKPVENADLQFAAIGAYSIEEHKLPLRPGLYLVQPDGRVHYFEGFVPGAQQSGSPEEFGDVTDAVSLSPDKTLLAVSGFPTLNGTWCFFSWPDGKPFDHPMVQAFRDDTSPALLWSGKEQVVVDAMDVGGGKRQCEYDPCGPISVKACDLATGKSTPIFKGTGLCDYRVQSVKNGQVTATKRCLRTVAAWKHFPENTPTETVTAPLP